MKIQINFEYNGVTYRQTIDENNVDMEHYEYLWDYWFGENDNELAKRHYKEKDEEDELVFEVTANKKWFNDDYGLCTICGEGIYVNVYPNSDADDYCELINTDDIEVLYA